MLGFGRALGETMALAMLVGNSNQLSLSLFPPANTLAALLALNFPEAGKLEEGVLMYATVVLLLGSYSAPAGGIALALLMIHTVMLTAEAAMQMVPARMKEAAVGMGCTSSQVVWRVVLPTALPGMLTGVLLAVARGVQRVPVVAGSIVLAYNLEGLGGELKLPRDVYVDIFLHEITTWDDPRLRAANPGLKLPSDDIALAVRQDSSGTTFAFTNHLSAISDQWRDRGPGVGTVIDWPGNAMAARGNEGVAGRIKQSVSSIGYVEYGTAQRAGLKMAWLENQADPFYDPASMRPGLTAANNPSMTRLSAGSTFGQFWQYKWLNLPLWHPLWRASGCLKTLPP